MMFCGIMAQRDSDVAVVGHFSIDSIRLPHRAEPFVVMGGSVAYVSLVARLLGTSVSVVSKVGGDFPEAYLWWLREKCIDLANVAKVVDEKSTRFELIYNVDFLDRTLKLKSKAPDLAARDLPNDLCAKIIHIAPIAGEIPLEVVEKLRNCGEILSLDPQGMTRSFDKNGNVAYASQMNERVLSLIDVYKSSLDEIKILTSKTDLNDALRAVHAFGPKIVIATMGTKGSVVSAQDALYNVPACQSTKVVDPTGAGDVFIGGFLAEYTNQKDVLWCACVASAAASLVVEGVGPTYLGDA